MILAIKITCETQTNDCKDYQFCNYTSLEYKKESLNPLWLHQKTCQFIGQHIKTLVSKRAKIKRIEFYYNILKNDVNAEKKGKIAEVKNLDDILSLRLKIS